MQLYAFDNSKQLVNASDADRSCDYFCMECGNTVRKRGGSHRIDHFYHQELPVHCQQHGKSIEHLQAQMFIWRAISGVLIERRFPEIGRIADVCWEEKKLIFEIQCSPIRIEEVRKRNSDYLSLGYEVIWILHSKRYGGRQPTAVEHFLTNRTHYFTDINKAGEGCIYDRPHVPISGLAIEEPNKLHIEIAAPLKAPPFSLKKRIVYASFLRKRSSWAYAFRGDILEQLMSVNLSLRHFLSVLLKRTLFFGQYFLCSLMRLYWILFRHYLEKACR